jgi:hypothetical protein
MRCASARPLQDLWHAIAPTIAPPGEIELGVDVDPINML